jgi:peptidoglycan/LPS O-acetylase OafA/YrhL
MQKTRLTNHIPALDGLRGLAIGMVIAYHYFPDFILFSIGWAGVDLFFVLSGFLITSRLLATLNDENYYRNFIRNRVLRIFPLYFSVLIIFFTILILLSKEHIDIRNYYGSHWLSFVFFTENWTFIFYGLPLDSYLNHFWSLAIEEQFYIIWPWIIYFITPARNRLVVFGIILISVVITRIWIHQFSAFPFAYYFNTFCRIDALLLGAFVAQIRAINRRIPQVWVNGILIFFVFLICAGIYVTGNAGLSGPFMATIGYTCVAVCFTCVICKVLENNRPVVNIFELPLLRYIGKISFGLYVFHWPVLLFVRRKMAFWGMNQVPFLKSTLLFSSAGISLLICFVISALSFRYFESRILKYKNQ